MAGKDGPLRRFAKLPERALGKVADVQKDAAFLRRADKGASLCKQAGIGKMAARKRVITVPRQRRHDEPLRTQFKKALRIAVDGFWSFQRKQRGPFSCLPCSEYTVCIICGGNQVRMGVQLPTKITQRKVQRLLRPAKNAFLSRVAAKGKNLCIVFQPIRLIQVDMTGVVQKGFAPAPKLKGRIAVSVQKPYPHSNASSRCRILGFCVCIPSGA